MLQSQSAVQSSELAEPPGVIQSLERVKERVREQLYKVPEFRALLAMETSIAEVSHITDLAGYLETAKEKITDRLTKVREYQAMLAVEKSITQISEVLGVLASGEGASATSAVSPETQAPPQTKATERAIADHLATVLGLGPIDQRIN